MEENSLRHLEPKAEQKVDETAWDSLGYILWQIALGWRQALEAELVTLNLTVTQWTLLLAVRHLQHSTGIAPTQRQLADFTGTDLTVTSQVVRTLANRGLLERHTHSVDTRAKQLTITTSGSLLADQGVPKIALVDARFFTTKPFDDTDVVDALRRTAQSIRTPSHHASHT